MVLTDSCHLKKLGTLDENPERKEKKYQSSSNTQNLEMLIFL